jgi:hypothetical protein
MAQLIAQEKSQAQEKARTRAITIHPEAVS